MTEADAQAALAEVALGLVAITDRLQQVYDALPASRNREAMLEHRIAYDIATELYGTIECVLTDYLRTVVQYVEAASRVTAEELREQHREQQVLLGRLQRRMRDEIGG
jgi:hypothetical protein